MPNTNDAMNALLREAIRGRRPLPSGTASKSRDVELGAINRAILIAAGKLPVDRNSKE
jgi:hypothetical protein